MSKTKHIYIFYLFILFVSYFTSHASAMIVIKDDEVESFLYELAMPIFDAAELDDKDVKIYIIQDTAQNAFTTDKKSIFINTGLMLGVQDVEGLAGIIAHEVGHIAERHFIKRQGYFEEYQRNMIFVGLAALAAGIVTQDPRLAIGTVLANDSMQNRMLFSYSRAQEYAADNASASYLKKLGFGIDPLIKFLKQFTLEESVVFNQSNQYYMTHPFSRDRVSMLKDLYDDKNIVKENGVGSQFNKKALQNAYNMVLAKLAGFSNKESGKNLLHQDIGVEAVKYFDTIVSYQNGNVNQALTFVDELIAMNPKSPYYQELKGEILYNSGNVNDAIIWYENAMHFTKRKLKFVNNIRLEFTNAFIVSERQNGTKRVLNIIMDVLKNDDANIEAWRQLSILYFRQNNSYIANLALAKRAILSNDMVLAERLITIVENSGINNDVFEALAKDLKIDPVILRKAFK